MHWVKKIALVSVLAPSASCGGGDSLLSDAFDFINGLAYFISTTSTPQTLTIPTHTYTLQKHTPQAYAAPTVVTPQSYPITVGLNNDLASTRSYYGIISGTMNGHSVTGTATLAQTTLMPCESTFEGKTCLAKTIRTTFNATANGQTLQSSSTNTLYFDTGVIFLGQTATTNIPGSNLSGSSYAVVSNLVLAPYSMTIGTYGEWYSQNIYGSHEKKVPVGTVSASYELVQNTATTANFNLIYTQYSSQNAVIGVVKYSYLIDTTGNVSYYSWTTSGPDTNATVTWH